MQTHVTSPSLAQTGQFLWTYLRPQRWPTLLMGGLLFSNTALMLYYPQIVRRFIDTVQAGGELAVLARIALLFLGVAVVQQVVFLSQTYVSENVGWTATNELRNDLASHCLRLDLSFHNTHTPGEMIERIDGDVTVLANFFSLFILRIVGNLLLMVGVMAALFVVDWRVGLVMTVFTVTVLAVLGRFRDIAVPHWAAERQASANLFSFLEERLSGTEDIRANGAQSYVMRRFYELMRSLLQKSLRAGMMVNILLNTTLVLFAAGTAAALAISTYLFQGKMITIGLVYMIFQYTVMLQNPIEEFSREMQDFQKAGASIGRVLDLLKIQSKVQDAPPATASPKKELPGGALAVHFQNVTFSYKDSAPDGQASQNHTHCETVLQDVSFSLQPGSVLGLLGRTGSGKTSLTRLLFRFYDPDSGAVLLAGANAALQPENGKPYLADGYAHDVREIPLAEVRKRVGMIPQTIQLFNASVRDNLTFFDPSIDDDRILQALHQLELAKWYEALPKGLDTELESGGSGLSAGEAQLLAFTRIFLKDPGLVILDEPSSRLDPATERLIESAVDRLVQERTAIIVAHRLSTVQRASHILILEGGRILEFERREALAGNPASHFYKLLQTGLEEVLA